MIKKRLLELLSDAMKYIKEQIIFKILSLICQIIIVICIAQIMSDVVTSSSLIISGNDIEIKASAYIKYIIPAIICIIARFFFDKKETESSFAASADVKKVLREKIYQKLICLGSSYKEKVSTAEITQLMTEGVDQLETYFGLYLSQLFYAMIAPAILFVVVAFVSIKAAIILLIFVPLIPISIVVVQKIAKRLLNKYWSLYANLGDSFLENIQGLTTLKIYQSDGKAADKMDTESEHFRNVTMKVLTMQLNSTSVMDIMAYGGAAAGIIIALSEYFGSHITLSGALIIILLSAEFFLPMRRLGSYFHIAMNGMAASDKIFNLLDLEEPENGTEEFPANANSITFDKVFFSYDQNDEENETSSQDTSLAPSGTPDDIGLVNKQKEMKAVLKGITMEIPKGSFTAIAGVSGSGKSTIASLIMGRQKNYSGFIKIGDTEISSIKEEELFKNITMVTSGAVLFKGTIRENLAIAASEKTIPDEEMLEALKKVNLLTLTNSERSSENDDTSILDYWILEGASNLSGGQRQRLAIARALLHNTDIYIFDEATSNIDAESEEMIMDVIREIAKEHTVILITHRLANVENADRIYMLKDGIVSEYGTHKELMNHFGSYSLLYNAQQKLENFNGGKCKTNEMPVHKTAAIETNATQEINSVIPGSLKNTNSTLIDDNTAATTSNTNNKKRGSALGIMLKLITLIKPLLPIMLLAITLGVLGFLCATFLTIRAAMIITGNGAFEVSAISFTKAMAMSLVIMAILRGILHYGEQYCNHFIAFKLLAIIRHKVFAALRKLAPAKLEGHDKGNIIAILTSDIELLEVFYAHTISPIVIAFVMTIIMVIFEWSIYPVAGIIALIAYAAVGIAIPLINGRRGADLGMTYRDGFGELNSYILESLRGLDETLQYGNGDKRKENISYKSVSLTSMQKVLSGYQADQIAVTNLAIQISTWIMLLAVIIAGANDFENAGKLIIAVVTIMSSFGPTIALSNLSNNLTQTLASARRVLDLLDESPVVKENEDGIKIYPRVENIYTQNISFSYNDQPILNDLSIGFPKGQIVGIHGPSGCGKSTLLKLLMRFWDTDSGSVRLIANDNEPDSNTNFEAKSLDTKDKAEEENTLNTTESKDKEKSTDNTTPGNDNEESLGKDGEIEPARPMSAIEMLKAMQDMEKEKLRIKKEHENAFLEKSKALAKQKEEARKKAAVEAEKVEKQKRMTLEERVKSFLPSEADKERSKDIKEVRTNSLRALQAYVTQDTYIFHDTIAENIRLAKSSATQEEIEEAAKKASLHDFIMSLPDGYETKVGELGDTLSGGERQRIGIARAFLNDADIILLDEPTSNLDSLNEGIILKSLKEGAGDKIIIIVSHRDSTMAVADNVYSFE